MKHDEIKKRYENDEMPALDMVARVMPETYNESDNTIQVEYTTGAGVKRFGFFDDFYGIYIEELSTKKGDVRLERMKQGSVPALDSHSSYSLRSILGTVVSGDETHAKIKFSGREDVKDMVQDIKDGVIRNISVGYRVHEYEDVTEDEAEIRTLRAIDWEPLEVSFVAVPADGGAGVRSEIKTNRCVIKDARANISKTETKKETNTMKKDKIKGQDDEVKNAARQAETETPTPAEAPKGEVRTEDTPKEVDNTEHVEAGRKLEKQRQDSIKDMVRKAGLGSDVSQRFIDEDLSEDKARAAVIDELAARSEKNDVNGSIRVSTPDGQLTRVDAMQSYLLHRSNPSAHKLDDQAREFMGASLLDMARFCLGERASKGLNKMELVERALHTTSDFPELLANTAGKSLRRGYENTRRSFLPFARQITLPDFKEMKRVALSNISSLVEVVEDGEYKRGTFGEGAEAISLSTYGRIIGISRQMIINDDMDALTRLPQKLGGTAARLENRMVYENLTANPLMADGVNLFAAGHNNLTDALLTVDGLGANRALMRVQKDPSGEDILNITPRFLVVPAALETTAAKLQAQVTADKADNVNPYASSFELIVEGQLDADSALNYYTIADPNEVDTIEYAYLEGQEGPRIESRDLFNRDGMEIKIGHDFATIPVDFRGMTKSTNDAA